MRNVLPALLLGLILGPFPLTAAQPVAARKPTPTPHPSQIKTAGEVLQLPDSFLQQWGDSTVFRAREVQRQFSNLQLSHPQKATGKRMQKILELNWRPLEFKQSYVPGPHIYFVDGVSSNRLSYRLQQLNSP
ncbi:hypothetical protein [Gimesia panareensis]|uniref:hypothetical protein n=1 Tax=Gimesia panareensis TaxID=2527978 RepID=UPI001187B49F|nr:hypothetical protein [Gimesia panareensis]QDU48307.1 hypothetical protein Pan110_06200 [Gimesia panareensis]